MPVQLKGIKQNSGIFFKVFFFFFTFLGRVISNMFSCNKQRKKRERNKKVIDANDNENYVFFPTIRYCKNLS